MSIPLAEALQQVELETGRTYTCQVRGKVVQVRVLSPTAESELPAIRESDIMLDAWTELPKPQPVKYHRSKLVPPKVPDIPEIPREEEGA